jgi:chaperone required for assembly of F1-ATPase
MKRFYKMASTAAAAGGHAVHLDGKPIKTPAGHALVAPTAALADAVMAEWAAQGDTIDPALMPLTQILTTAIDRAIPQRAAITAEILNYLDTDLLCYRTDRDDGLSRWQSERWDPPLDWFTHRYGVPLATTAGLSALRQPAAAHDAAARAVAALDDYRFSALQLVVAISGSLVLGLALAEEAIDASAVFAAANVEEDFKAALYNEDIHGRAPHQEKREESVRRDLAAAQDFMALL